MASSAAKKRRMGRPPIPEKFKSKRKEIADRLRRYRELAGLSVPQISEAVGVKEDDVRAFEDATKPIASEYLCFLADAVGVRPALLLGER